MSRCENAKNSGYLAVDSVSVKKISESAIITGVGNEIHIHDDTGKHHVLPIPFRLQGKVHGLESGTHANSERLLVYGEKEFMLLQCSKEGHILLYKAKLTDWISAGRFLKEYHQFILLTAHSVLLKLQFHQEDRSLQILTKSSCIDKSTLYCSHINGGSSWNDIMIFGGNAFGELMIWQPNISDQENNLRPPLQQRVLAHKGVVFSIDYDEQESLLLTTSDDRSITFWSLAGKLNGGTITRRSSGFGHIARVFQGRFIRYDERIFAVTVGEDSYVCIWNVPSAELVFKRRQQFGATIWNFDYDETSGTLFTVGSTGNLLAYGLREILSQKEEIGRISFLPMNPENSSENEKEYMAKVRFLSENLLIAVSNQNRWFYKDLSESSVNNKWQFILLPQKNNDKTFKCTVLEVYGKLVAFCGYQRVVLLEFLHDTTTEKGSIVNFKILFDDLILDGMIRAYHFLNPNAFIVSDALGNCMLIHLRNNKLDQRISVQLMKCREPWLTSALLIDDRYLLVSNRKGNLLLYKYDEKNSIYTLQDRIINLHGNMGSTTLKCLTTTEPNKTICHIQSAGRDASLKLLCLDKSDSTLTVCSRENVPITWIEDIIQLSPDMMIDSSTSTLLIGFNDNHLMTWCRDHDVTCQIDCGGGHRCWHYIIYKEQQTNIIWLQLVFIKSKTVRLCRLKLFNQLDTLIGQPQLRNRWHVKPCNMATLWHGLLISAGDDNLIKVTRLVCNKSYGTSLQQLAEIQTHISNVRALKVLPIPFNSKTCLIFSGGGRAQFCITQLSQQANIDDLHVKELMNHIITDSICAQNTNVAYKFNSETRIMSLDVLSNWETNQLSVYLGCSDGWVRCLELQWSNETIHILQMEQQRELFCGKCVLQIRLIPEKSLVIVTTTDGYIRIYDLTLTSLLMEVQHHDSAVNVLDLYVNVYEKELLHLLSGGDDQAIVYSQIDLSNSILPKLISTFRLPYEHTAQVTAVLMCFRNNELYAYTSGIDQTLRYFKIDVPFDNPIRSETFHTTVADIKGLCVEDNMCYIYGCGLQIQQFPSNGP